MGSGLAGWGFRDCDWTARGREGAAADSRRSAQVPRFLGPRQYVPSFSARWGKQPEQKAWAQAEQLAARRPQRPLASGAEWLGLTGWNRAVRRGRRERGGVLSAPAQLRVLKLPRTHCKFPSAVCFIYGDRSVHSLVAQSVKNLPAV